MRRASARRTIWTRASPPSAFNPSDNTVPSQYSGYGSTGDAFTLGSDLVSGSTYELVTADGSNYIIVYTVTDTDQDSINQSRVVLSKVQETTIPDEDDQPTSDTVYGLVHPFDADERTPYLVLDNDANGDLDFDAWGMKTTPSMLPGSATPMRQWVPTRLR